MRRIVMGLVVLAGTLAGARVGEAVVTGQIFGPGSESYPIAIMPLKDAGGDANGALGTRFAQALSRDLDLSGYFRLLDPKTFIERPESSGTTAAEIDFVGWAAVGAQALVKGTVQVTGDGTIVEVRLFDVPGRQEVAKVGRRYTGGRADVPRMAHKTADAILEVLTGERGPFDSSIALVSTRSGRLKDVYRWSFDQDDPVRLTDERSLVALPKWRADTRAVVYISYRQHVPHLFQIDVGSRQVTRLVGGPGQVLDGVWSPDGNTLLVTREEGGNSDIYLVDPGGRTLKRLTDHWAIDVAPAWAPDGRRFAFCSARAGSPQIYVMNIDGSGLVRVSHAGSYNTSPAWSPKGDLLAWTTRAGGGFQIVVADVDGSRAKTITAAGSNENPSWGPDGRYLVFSSTRAGRASLFLADRDGRTQKQLTRGAGDDTSPTWSRRLE
jgi:TolB protein